MRVPLPVRTFGDAIDRRVPRGMTLRCWLWPRRCERLGTEEGSVMLRSSIRWVTIAACALIASIAVTVRAEDYVIVGSAYHAEDGDVLLYQERYTPVLADGRAEVHYFAPEGRRIAEKILDYSYGDEKPGFELQDLRQDLHWAARWSGDRREIRLERGSRKNRETGWVEARSSQVIDAGFDAFLRSSWDRWMSGEQVTFYFAFANRLTNLRLRAERIPAAKSGIRRQGEGWVYLRIRPGNMLLSLFADALYLAYDEASRRLMVFRGRSNLPDAQGSGWDVEIHYEYPASLPRE